MDYNFIKNLIGLAEEYELERSDLLLSSDVQSFAEWLLKNKPEKPIVKPSITEETIDSRIVKNLVYMVRFVQNYAEEILQNTILNTLDELVFLIQLQFNGPSNATQLAKEQLLKKTTAISIVKRLQLMELVEIQDNPLDKRSKNYSISSKGSGVLFSSLNDLTMVSEIATGRLEEHEKIAFLSTLNKLYDFHIPFLKWNEKPNLNEIHKSTKIKIHEN